MQQIQSYFQRPVDKTLDHLLEQTHVVASQLTLLNQTMQHLVGLQQNDARKRVYEHASATTASLKLVPTTNNTRIIQTILVILGGPVDATRTVTILLGTGQDSIGPLPNPANTNGIITLFPLSLPLMHTEYIQITVGGTVGPVYAAAFGVQQGDAYVIG